ncbi:MAG: glycosyltransferase family 4 protein [Rhodothermales bacterium]|nr:glycosyltransferase family 4 protein [Rhodothermales bacterium]
MTRIAVAGYFPPPITGQTMATERLAALLEDVFRVDRIALNEGHDEQVETRPGIRLGKIRGYLHAGRQLRAAFRATPPDVLLWPAVSPKLLGHIRDLMAVMPALPLAARRYGVVHWGNFATLFESPLTRFTARRLVRALDGFVFLNPSLAERCAAWIPAHKRFAIPNTIDDTLCFSDAEIAGKQEDRRRHERPLRLLFLSNMIPSKGYDDVVEATALLHAREIPVELRLAGRWIDGADRRAFETRTAGELASCVTHLGPLTDRNAIRALHQWADVFVFPTYYPTEAQPLALLEAMSAGTPIVTTAHAGIPDMLAAGREALFVPPRDPEAIAGAVMDVQDAEPWQRHSEAVRRRFLADFSPEAVRRQWTALVAGAAPDSH